MRHYFGDFVMGSISYRPLWFELFRGKDYVKVKDDEAVNVFSELGWKPCRVGYARLFNGHIDVGKERAMTYAEFRRLQVWP